MKRRSLFVLCLVLPTLLSLSVQAAEPTAALIDKAASLYAGLDFEAAADLLDQALVNPGNSSEQLVRIHHLRGLIQGSLGRYDDAKKSFAVILALRPSFRLGSDVAPRVRGPFMKLATQKPPRFDMGILPPPTAVVGKPLIFTSQVKTDSLGMARKLVIYYRRSSGKYSQASTELAGKGEYRLSIPAPLWQGSADKEPVSWYAVVEDENKAQLRRFGDELHPLVIDVMARPLVSEGPKPASWYEKWWVWTIVGGVVAAGTATALVLTTTGASAGPHDFTIDFQ